MVATSWDSLWSLLSIIFKKSWHFFQNPSITYWDFTRIRTTDAWWGNCLHCKPEKSLPLSSGHINLNFQIFFYLPLHWVPVVRGILLLVIDIGFDYIFYLIIFGTIAISLEPQNGTPACKESLYINSSFPFILSYRFRKLAKLLIWFNLYIWKGRQWNILDLTLIFEWEK